MKKFEIPAIDVERFEMIDVITTSTSKCAEDNGLPCLAD